MSIVTAVPPLRRGAPEPPGIDEHDMYPVHEEDNVPEKMLHEAQARYLRGALAAYFPDRLVTGEVCMYWEERNFYQYAAPDVLVVDGPRPDPLPSTYLRWSDPPPLLVIEVGSRSTFVRDEGPKLDIYAYSLRVPNYLYYHPDRRLLQLFRLTDDGYHAVPPDARGWVYSETVDLWFGVDESGWLRIYTPAGERLLGHEEEARARQEADARAAAAEGRLAEVEAELQRLRARMPDADTG